MARIFASPIPRSSAAFLARISSPGPRSNQLSSAASTSDCLSRCRTGWGDRPVKSAGSTASVLLSEKNASSSSSSSSSSGLANAAGGKNDVDEDDDHDASFSDNTTNAVDPADYTGRSPHPVLHLLRQSDVDAADESWFDKGPGDDIRARNAALLRGMGEGKLRAMLKKCFESASRDESKRR